MSKLDVEEDYHQGTLRPSQLGAFAYIIPSVAVYYYIIICIYMVLLMVWMDSPKFFCAFSDILTDLVNTLVHMSLTVPGCIDIANTPDTVQGPPHTLDSLTHNN